MHWLKTLRSHFGIAPEKTALEWLDAQGAVSLCIRYGQLESQVSAAAARLLSLGIGPGDRVALWSGKSPSFVYHYLAALHLGAVALPLNPDCTLTEARYYLEDSAAAVVLVDDARDELAKSLHEFSCVPLGSAPVSPSGLALGSLPLPEHNATALMIYTSGTTGRAKGAEITHANLGAQLDALHEMWDWRAEDRLLHALPLFHVHGLIVALHAALHAGATAALLPRFDPVVVLQLLATRSYSVYMGVPTMHRRLVDRTAGPVDLSHVRLVTSGSDRLPEALFDAFRASFGIELLERYGMTETGMLLSNPLGGPRRPGSVGFPLPGVSIRIAHLGSARPLPDETVGEVQVRGANIFKGYWRQPEQTAEAFTADGWFRTGDLGLRQPDGSFWLKGRAKDLIISGGYNIYPAEVEQALLAHPAVAACSVIGVADEQWGERVAAAVVLATDAGAPPPSLDALIAHCRDRLAPYKVPRHLLVLTDLPRNALGKVQKDRLRAIFAAEDGTPR